MSTLYGKVISSNYFKNKLSLVILSCSCDGIKNSNHIANEDKSNNFSLFFRLLFYLGKRSAEACQFAFYSEELFKI